MAKRSSPLYWRPSRIPASVMLALAMVATICVLVVEFYKTEDKSADFYDVMLRASQTVDEGIKHLRPIRGRAEPIDPEVDPLRSGMIGLASSSVTSNSGDLEAKRTAVNPNWAAVTVKLLVDAGVQKGDLVAVAVSGSFPAINLAVYSAVEALGVEPIIIASASASQWGANVPGHIWLDMARELRQAGIIKSKAVAATLGGREDRALGLSKSGIASLKKSMEEAGVRFMDVADYRQSVARRIALYREQAAGQPIKAMVNVGGGVATTGPPSIDHLFDGGLNRTAPTRAFAAPSVMGYFLNEGVPVVHFSGIENMAAQFELPRVPMKMPAIGDGGVYNAKEYRRWLAGGFIILLLGLTTWAMRSANIALAFDGSRTKTSGQMRPKV